MKHASLILLCAMLLSIGASATGERGTQDVVYSWHSNEKKIALTFDDGPHPVHTPEILRILSEYDIKATFFVIGDIVAQYPETLCLVASEGHEIGNHTASHLNLKQRDADTIEKEIRGAERAVYETVGRSMTLLRPPGGCLDDTVCRVARENDYTVICWSVDTLDWAHTPSEQIVESILGGVEGGDIILFHDFVAGKSPTPDVLRQIIPVLIHEGYSFVTVSELLETGG